MRECVVTKNSICHCERSVAISHFGLRDCFGLCPRNDRVLIMNIIISYRYE
jgi:hypothetical protein